MKIKSIALISYAIFISVVFTHTGVASELPPITNISTGVILVTKNNKGKAIKLDLVTRSDSIHMDDTTKILETMHGKEVVLTCQERNESNKRVLWFGKVISRPKDKTVNKRVKNSRGELELAGMIQVIKDKQGKAIELNLVGGVSIPMDDTTKILETMDGEKVRLAYRYDYKGNKKLMIVSKIESIDDNGNVTELKTASPDKP